MYCAVPATTAVVLLQSATAGHVSSWVSVLLSEQSYNSGTTAVIQQPNKNKRRAVLHFIVSKISGITQTCHNLFMINKP